MDWYTETVRRKMAPQWEPSEACIEIIEYFEGFRAEAYQDSVGIWTIGFGSTKGVERGDTTTKAKASLRMLAELEAEYGEAVQRVVKVPITQYEFDALVCFSYNVGTGALTSSTLLRKLNAGDYEGAADEFPRWSKAAGKTLKGLFRRRTGEQLLFEGDDWERFKEISG